MAKVGDTTRYLVVVGRLVETTVSDHWEGPGGRGKRSCGRTAPSILESLRMEPFLDSGDDAISSSINLMSPVALWRSRRAEGGQKLEGCVGPDGKKTIF